MYSHRQLRGRRLALGAEPSLNELFGGQVVYVCMQGPSAVHFIVDYPLLGQAAI